MGGTHERTFARPLKAAAAALLLGGLLALVMLGSRGGHPGGSARLHQREVPAQAANDLFTIVAVVYVLAVIVILVAAYLMRAGRVPPKKSRWLAQMLMLVVLAGVFALFASRVRHTDLLDRLRRGGEQGQRVPTTARRTPTLPNRPAARRPAELDWVLVALIGGGIVLAAVVVRARRREPPPAVEEEETVEEELSAVVGDTIDDLRREADARRAVIAAYARMERVLAVHGHPRSPSEAPFEYLSRVLLRLRVRAGAVNDLTELFERAKFSTHEIDPPMKERAITALVAVRQDLEAAPA